MDVKTSLICLSALVVGVGGRAMWQESEPPLQLLVEGLGEDRIVALGETFEVTLGEETHRVTLSRMPNRELCLPQLCFEYPSTFNFEYEDSFGLKMWTVEGNDLTVIAQVFATGQDLEFLVGSIAGELASASDAEPRWGEAPTLAVDGFDIDSARFVIPWGDFEFRTNVYAIQPDGARNTQTFLVVQEVMEPHEGASEETEAFLELLRDTMRGAD